MGVSGRRIRRKLEAEMQKRRRREEEKGRKKGGDKEVFLATDLHG